MTTKKETEAQYTIEYPSPWNVWDELRSFIENHFEPQLRKMYVVQEAIEEHGLNIPQTDALINKIMNRVLLWIDNIPARLLNHSLDANDTLEGRDQALYAALVEVYGKPPWQPTQDRGDGQPWIEDIECIRKEKNLETITLRYWDNHKLPQYAVLDVDHRHQMAYLNWPIMRPFQYQEVLHALKESRNETVSELTIPAE